MIRTSMSDGRGGVRELKEHEPEYWEGPYRYEPFPKMLFHATAGEGFTNPEMRVVKNQQEWDHLGTDWAESPDSARAIVEKRDAAIAQIAAERNFSDQKMSELARAEALKADRATDEMVPAIPEKRRGGRPKKIVVAES